MYIILVNITFDLEHFDIKLRTGPDFPSSTRPVCLASISYQPEAWAQSVPATSAEAMAGQRAPPTYLCHSRSIADHGMDPRVHVIIS